MNIDQLIIVAVLLVLLAEVTYLVAKLPRQVSGKKRMIFVDTSVLIDGRIIAVAKSGFIGDTLAIPRSVIGELQFLADNADHDKRARARYGLDVVKELQEMPEVDATILQDGSKAAEGVDERLLNLAKKYNGVVCTIDYNLNKVAAVEGISVLNVNELAQSLRMAYLPGEKILLEMVQKGQDSHQAVGYLPDGTMVVVEHAIKQLGQTIEIEFIRSLQTAAGKMMFAKRVETKEPAKEKHPVLKSVKGRQPVSASLHSEKAETKPLEQPAQKPAKPSKARTQKTAKEPTEVPPQPAPTTVYHSDEREQQRTQRARNPRQRRKSVDVAVKTDDSEIKSSSQPKVSESTSNQQARRKPRPKTSAQREAALIDLVEKQ